MSSFDFIIDWEPYTTDFRGREVAMQLRPLKRWASILLTPIYEESGEIAKKKEKVKKFIKDQGKDVEIPKELQLTNEELNFIYRVQEVATKVFPEHVKDITGITINKKPITIIDLCDETAFGSLCMDIIGELSKRSQLLGDEEKNLDGPSGTSSKTDDNTKES